MWNILLFTVCRIIVLMFVLDFLFREFREKIFEVVTEKQLSLLSFPYHRRKFLRFDLSH